MEIRYFGKIGESCAEKTALSGVDSGCDVDIAYP
jgi:hypothetical protein